MAKGTELERAIKMLENEYERAKTLKHIHNPLAYALYHVWRWADNLKGRSADNE